MAQKQNEKITAAQRETVVAAFRNHKKMILAGLRQMTGIDLFTCEKVCSALVDEGVLKRGTITIADPSGWEYPVTQYKIISKPEAAQGSLFPEETPPQDQDGAKLFIEK